MSSSPSSPTPSPESLLPFADFEAASYAVLDYLRERINLRLWMVTRAEGDDWLVLAARDKAGLICPGSVFNWQDSFCYHMVAGRGPSIAPDASRVEVYSNSPIARTIRIGAYIGVPIMRTDGTLFGTLCGIDPEPQPEEIAAFQPVIELLSRQLATLFEFENQFEREQRLRERIEAEAMIDDMTSVYNRNGWEKLIEKEEQRCRRYGHTAGILIIDLDDLKDINDSEGHEAGDVLLHQAAKLLQQCNRASDVIARLGGDEFGILGVEMNSRQTEALGERVQQCLADGDINASVGWATRHGEVDINQAIKQADRMMYAHKRRRKHASTER
ncbi:diguanylate cyclase (GGDEF)-like protein [Methylohalomonas lacus]|uniref:diguanylate cyclase n=1 Tax=Methylohalomonas lacus TaxID=398773 RepID=A0AAE3HNA0_9GAMM|nr:sensor domain-containing diguanylate cyclase [Methylohalomonas lacus]MCS3904289.1 diguanylate cyclase (GGDEF)-like protein [Methylohalomonas lacus]